MTPEGAQPHYVHGSRHLTPEGARPHHVHGSRHRAQGCGSRSCPCRDGTNTHTGPRRSLTGRTTVPDRPGAPLGGRFRPLPCPFPPQVNGAPPCLVARSSAWPSPARSSSSRRCWSWTRRPAPWTRSPSGSCRRPWTAPAPAAPCWSSPTGSAPYAGPTTSSSWPVAVSVRSAGDGEA